MFNFIKNTLQKIYGQVTVAIGTLCSRSVIDETVMKELEILLLQADTGTSTTRFIMDRLRAEFAKKMVQTGEELRAVLQRILCEILQSVPTVRAAHKPSVLILIGVNGSGKTTTAAKLAYDFLQKGEKPLLVAADTFRAAATEQLSAWGKQIGVEVITGKTNQDPASVVFEGCRRYKQGNYTTLVIDTAGRLHTKNNLMKELEKIQKIVNRECAGHEIDTLITLDSMIGQSSFEQVQAFRKNVSIDGIILTKLDGTGKGGTIFAITQELKVPVLYITFGEENASYAVFDPAAYVASLLAP